MDGNFYQQYLFSAIFGNTDLELTLDHKHIKKQSRLLAVGIKWKLACVLKVKRSCR